VLIALFLVFYSVQPYNKLHFAGTGPTPTAARTSIAFINELPKRPVIVADAVAFLARAMRIFHYAIAIALSTSDDTVNSLRARTIPRARPTPSMTLMARLTRWQN
jgi:glucosamine 6-phosphate synthetase-like amidotransferase/phosphosugar isomerase protein